MVPAECIECFTPDLMKNFCTSATSVDTDADPVPIGTMQTSAMHEAGAANVSEAIPGYTISKIAMTKLALIVSDQGSFEDEGLGQ